MKTVKTPRDEITVGTEHKRSEEWKGRSRVAGAKLRPDLVWLRCDSGYAWRKVVVDVKITSSEDLNKVSREKDEKYHEWATLETRENEVANAVMGTLISYDGAVHRDTVRRWKDFASDIQFDLVRMAQNVLRYNVVIIGKFFIGGSLSRRPGEKSIQKDLPMKQMALRKGWPVQRNEESSFASTPNLWVLCMCGLRASNIHMALG